MLEPVRCGERSDMSGVRGRGEEGEEGEDGEGEDEEGGSGMSKRGMRRGFSRERCWREEGRDEERRDYQYYVSVRLERYGGWAKEKEGSTRRVLKGVWMASSAVLLLTFLLLTAIRSAHLPRSISSPVASSAPIDRGRPPHQSASAADQPCSACPRRS
jgi:hypothetical protein